MSDGVPYFLALTEQDPGCLKKGPWSVQVFDVIARISARLIISCTRLGHEGTGGAKTVARGMEPDRDVHALVGPYTRMCYPYDP